MFESQFKAGLRTQSKTSEDIEFVLKPSISYPRQGSYLGKLMQG